MKTKVFQNFEEKLEDLEKTVIDCNNIIISDEPFKFCIREYKFFD